MFVISFNVSTFSKNLLFRSFSSGLSKELKSLQELCRKFSDEELNPVASQLDKLGKFPKQQIEKLGALGMMGICVPTEYGGSGMSTLALSIIVEELSRGCGSTGSIVSIHNCLYANLIQRLGSHDQKLKFLKPLVSGSNIGAFALSESDAGSDVAALSTTAIKKDDSYILNGSKAWVTSGIEAEVAVVFATVDKALNHKGITAFIVELNSPGVDRGKNEQKLGIRATSTCSLGFIDVQINSSNMLGDSGNGFKIAMEQLDQARIGIASQALGIAQASLDTAITYASQRIAFKKPILEMSSVQNRLADMALRIEASRLLVRNAAHLKDQNVQTTMHTSMAKWHASETATFCSHNCIQILGGMGVVEDFSAERFYRDARITEIYGGATDIQKLIVASQLKKNYGL
ncbi:CLUMA_CG007920, isoform A [Clunio marinus]|uniref:Short-chain specific acyl-CoA dehydrogenase, mitochondrial n=1 Tax=Clunio marinus TaxID=568069 RepID=A0A1J1I296_9DIPT|nr:CLUMA_CG007920, isoform A [Clunio marinus]